MIRLLLPALSLAALLFASFYFLRPREEEAPRAPKVATTTAPAKGAAGDAADAEERELSAAALRRSAHAADLRSYAAAHGYSANVAFLVDMRLPSGRARFFIHDLRRDSVLAAGLVAHGSCNMGFLQEASFGSEPGCGCTSLGRYKVGYAYKGNWGKAFKLYGLDASNRTAFERFVVLHGYTCVPDEEVYPVTICNSLGCPMLSYKFLEKASAYIAREKKPVLLWVYR